MNKEEQTALAIKARDAGFAVNVDAFGRLELVSLKGGRSAIQKPVTEVRPNSFVVREAFRTLTRLEKTELVRRYTSAIVHLARETYPEETEFHDFVMTGGPKPLTNEQMKTLSVWVKEQPWYIYSLIVGLAANDENMAWGLARG